MRQLIAALLVSTTIVIPSVAACATWYVPSQCPTIQAGIDSASAGDTVLVACGTYYEHDITLISGIVLRSETGLADCVTIDAQELGRVLLCDSVDDIRIEGFTITGGAEAWGAGLFCNASSLTLEDVIFMQNHAHLAGGGLYCCYESVAELVNCTFLENTATDEGGGSYFSSDSSASLTGCLFSGNSVEDRGGGISCYDCTLMLIDCAFSENSATHGGAMGGGLFSMRSFATLSDCAFSNNRATYGGALGGGIACSHNYSLSLTSCAFTGNRSRYGGGVCCRYDSPSTVENCTFSDNRAQNHGGGMFCYESLVTLANCTFSGNVAGAGGGILCENNSEPTITNCTFAGNSATSYGGGIHCCYGSSGTVANTIVAFSSAGEAVYCVEAYLTLSCCDLFGNAGGDWVGCVEGQYGVNGNFSECPLFCDPENEDFHLQVCSPCAPGNHPQGYDCGLIGALDVACECGLPSAVESATWSSLKALYR